MYSNNESIIKEIALEDIKFKIQASFFMLLSNAQMFKSKDCWNIPYDKDENLKLIENRIFDCIINLDNFFQSDSSTRDEQISSFVNLKNEFLEISESIYCYFYYSSQLKNIADIYLKLIVLKETHNLDTNEDVLYNKCLDFINKNNNTEIDKIPVIMSSLPLKMTREKYHDYIKDSLNIMLEHADETLASDLIKNLKLKFLASNIPSYGLYYKEIHDKLETISSLDMENLTYDELAEIQESLEDSIQIFSEIEDYLATVHESINSIIYILTFTHDIDFILEENLLYKDIFYACKDSLINNNDELNERLEELISSTCENLVDRIIDMKKSINRVFKDNDTKNLSKETLEILQIRELITDVYYENFSDVIYPIRLPLDENSSIGEDVLESKTNELLEYIKSSSKLISNKNNRLLKQFFLENLPYPFSVQDFVAYLTYILESTNDQEKAMVAEFLDTTLQSTTKL